MFEDLDELAARLLATAPAQDDPYDSVLDLDGVLVDRLVSLARVISAAQAETMVIQAAMHDWAETWQTVHEPRAEVTPADLVAGEIGPALHLATGTAAIHVDRAVTIVTRLPRTLAALRRGDLDLGRVLAIVDATMVLSDEDASRVEADVLGKAVDQTAGELRAALRKAVIRIDPAAAERRRKEAVKGRRVTKYQRDDGMAALEAVLSAADSGEIYDLVDEMARQMKTDGDTRSMDERRADALVIIITGRDPHLGPQDQDPPPPAAPADGPPGGPADPEPDQPEPNQPDPGTEPADEWPVPDQPTDLDDRFDRFDDGDLPVDPDDQSLGDLVSDEQAPEVPTAAVEPQPDDPRPGAMDPDDGHLVSVEADAAEQARRTADLNRFDQDTEARTSRISEQAAYALSAMTRRRPPRSPWVAINQSTRPDGTVVLVGELQGYGPITHQYAQHLLSCGAARAPDQPTGKIPTPVQAARHDPPEWLANEVKARDSTCRYPGCKQPAHRTDLDHTIDHPRGLTVRGNLGALCRRHHRIKGSRCWTVHQHDDGIYEWTSKITSRTYTTYPRGTTGDWQGTTTKRPDVAG